MGHGRSYGQRSRVLGRSLPGIVDCGLWDALPHGGGRPTYALLTDIGNDVMYGASVPSILGWIQTCMDRLLGAQARIAMTLLPMAGIKQLSRWRYEVARTLLFPGTRLSQTDAVSTATQLNDRLRELGHERGVDLVELVSGVGQVVVSAHEVDLEALCRHVSSGFFRPPHTVRGV